MTNKILDFYKSFELVITRLVQMVVSIFSFSIGELAPLLAPLPPSFSIYLAMSERLNMPFYVALCSAVTVEIVGMYSSKVSVRCYRWNATRNKSEPSVPQGLSILMTGIFFLVVICMALTIELLPGLVSLIFPMFTLISISTYTNLAIDSNLRKLETDKANDIEQRQAKNGLNADIKNAQKELEKLTNERAKLANELKAIRSQIDRQMVNKTSGGSQFGAKSPLNGVSLEVANGARADKIAKRREILLTLASDETLTQKDMAERLGVSITTIKNDIKALNGKVSNE